MKLEIDNILFVFMKVLINISVKCIIFCGDYY